MKPTSTNSPALWIKFWTHQAPWFFTWQWSILDGGSNVTSQQHGGRSRYQVTGIYKILWISEEFFHSCLCIEGTNHKLTWTSFLAVLACTCNTTGCRTLGEPRSYQGSPRLKYASSNGILLSHDGYLATSPANPGWFIVGSSNQHQKSHSGWPQW